MASTVAIASTTRPEKVSIGQMHKNPRRSTGQNSSTRNPHASGRTHLNLLHFAQLGSPDAWPGGGGLANGGQICMQHQEPTSIKRDEFLKIAVAQVSTQRMEQRCHGF